MQAILPAAEIFMERGEGLIKSFKLTTFPVSIGRHPENNVVLSDNKVSNFHLRIKKRGKLFIVEDLDSKNGCFINGDKILSKVLRSGDKILIGNTELLYISFGEVNFSESFMNFNVAKDDTLGIQSIDLQSESVPPQATYQILRLHETANARSQNMQEIKLLFDFQSDIMVGATIHECALNTIKKLPSLVANISRAVFVIISPANHNLAPVALSQFNGQSGNFSIHKSFLSQAIANRKCVFVHDLQDKELNKQIVVLPILHQTEIIGIIHFESDQIDKPILEPELVLCHQLCELVAAHFHSLVLKSEIDGLMLGMVESMVATIEAKDTYTVGHSERVCRYSMAIADGLKLDRDTKKLLMISSLCHDVGKIGIPDNILKKASFLSSDEYEEMKLHPVIGANIISYIPNAQRFISGVKYHHEKWDGTGYPEGLAGEDIPFFGRIVSVADTFDAMISGRSYSGFIDESDAIDKIHNESDLFDPNILQALIRAWESGLLTQRTSTVSNIHDKEKK